MERRTARNIFTYTNTYLHIPIRIYIYIYIYIHIHTYVPIYTYIQCIYIHTYLPTYLYIYNIARAIQAFVMYCVNGTSRSSLLIESTDSMIIYSGNSGH